MAHFPFLILLLFCVYTVQVLCAGESNEGVVQVLDPVLQLTPTISQVLVPVLQLPPLYHKYLSLSYSYLPFITSTGPCPTVTPIISQVVVSLLQLPPLYHRYWSLSNSCPPISQVVDPVLLLPPLYHKYLSLSYSYLPYITCIGLCSTVTSTLSQVLDPVI